MSNSLCVLLNKHYCDPKTHCSTGTKLWCVCVCVCVCVRVYVPHGRTTHDGTRHGAHNRGCFSTHYGGCSSRLGSWCNGWCNGWSWCWNWSGLEMAPLSNRSTADATDVCVLRCCNLNIVDKQQGPYNCLDDKSRHGRLAVSLYFLYRCWFSS